MNMDAQKLQPVTLAEFAAMPKDSHLTYELIDGVVMMSPSPSRKHQFAAHQLHGFLFNLLHKPCRAVGELDIEWKDNVLQPDVMVLCQDDAEIPEIVYEILSPSTQYRDLGIKFALYEAMGVKEYWIIDTKLKSVTVHDFIHRTSASYICGETIHSSALPEIVIAVADIFV